MVIDRSGSMGYGEYGISKLEMAKEAAASSVETLTDKDTVGILTFDDSYDWAIPPTSAKNNKETITNRIRQITMGGGTSIYPALQEAYDSLLEIDTKLKHIILLTDGQDSSTGYERLINQMKSDDITLSAVSVGSDSDGKLLKRLTELSGGRYYYTDEFTDLPKIFAKETFLAGKSFINNIDFYPQGDFSSSILSEIDNMPMLKGYISASEKTLADVILSSDEGDPILSTWQYGLGRTVAWTSDIKGNWTDNWLSTDEGVKIIRNAIALTLKKNIDESAAITVEKDGNERELIFELPFSREIENVSAIINDVHNNSYEVDFSSDAPGKYRAKFPDGKPGTYIATMEIEKADSKENYVIGFNIPYGKEYDIREFGKGYSLIEKLAHTTRGKILNSPKDLLSLPDINNERYKDISNTLLISALILFLIDIFLRRFSFLVDKLEAMMYKTINSLGKEKSKNKTEIKLEIKPNKDVSEKEPIIDNEKEKDTSSILLDRMKKRKRD